MAMRMKIYLTLSIILAAWIAFYVHVVMAQSVEMPVTVTIINCVDYPDDERCLQFDLNDLEPAAGVAEWTPEEPVTIEHFE